MLEKEYKISKIALGYLDITFFRDDFRRTNKPLEANKTKIDFIVENKKVVFIDDVLYTGRSIRSALTAIQSFGRPSEIELLVLIDRRFQSTFAYSTRLSRSPGGCHKRRKSASVLERTRRGRLPFI